MVLNSTPAFFYLRASSSHDYPWLCKGIIHGFIPCRSNTVVFRRLLTLSAISAISPGNRLLFSLGRKNFGAAEVVKFLNQLMKAHPARVIVVVLDNASSHRSKLVKNFERDNSNLKLYFLPTYSPQWNPDEKVWNHLKSIELIGHKERDLDGLEKLTRKKLSKMARTPKLLRGIFMRCEVAKFFI